MNQSVSPNTLSGGTPGGLFWAGLLAVVLALYFATGSAVHLTLLRALLILTAVGEALAFVSNSLRPRRFAEQCGRPYDPAYHGVMQDFGFYNLAFALLLVLAAFDPPRYALAIGVVIASYLVHSATHVLRYFGLYFGGGGPIPTRPRAFELRDGCQLLVPALGMILFFPL
jgi:hypothetical protein